MDRSKCSILRVIFVFSVFGMVLGGCATLPMAARSDRFGETGPLGNCADFSQRTNKFPPNGS